MPLLQLAAHTSEEIMRVNLDAVELDRQRARLFINDDAAGRMQRVLVSGSRATGPGLCHQLIFVIIPEPVRHGCDDFAFELLDVNCLWHGRRQAGHLHHATSPQDCVIQTDAVVSASPTTPPGVRPWTRQSDGDIAERRLTHDGRRGE